MNPIRDPRWERQNSSLENWNYFRKSQPKHAPNFRVSHDMREYLWPGMSSGSHRKKAYQNSCYTEGIASTSICTEWLTVCHQQNIGRLTRKLEIYNHKILLLISPNKCKNIHNYLLNWSQSLESCGTKAQSRTQTLKNPNSQNVENLYAVCPSVFISFRLVQLLQSTINL